PPRACQTHPRGDCGSPLPQRRGVFMPAPTARLTALLSVLAVLTACTDRVAAPTGPGGLVSAPLGTTVSRSAGNAATPPFNNEIILQDVGDGKGFGHVKFRQPKDDNLTIYLDTWVRDLAPN